MSTKQFKYVIWIAMIVGLCKVAVAEESVVGKVLDVETHEALPFTSIAVAGGHIGTVSNAEGVFALDSHICLPTDTLIFSFMGYETLKIPFEKLVANSTVWLRKATIRLMEIEVTDKMLSAEEIIALVRKNYPINYPQPSSKQRVFLHKYERVPFADKNQLTIKKSDFVGLDRNTINELYDLMPSEFIEYQDAILDLYTNDNRLKIVQVQAVSLEESAMKDLGKLVEEKLGAAMEDIDKANLDQDVYFKFRTGIIGIKDDIGKGTDATKPNEGESAWQAQKNDTIHYHVGKSEVMGYIRLLLDDYASLKSKNWEFITHPGQYKYTLGDMSIYNDEWVYVVHFQPKKSGLFEGTLYIAATSFALLQMDFAYAAGKRSEHIQLLGIGHTMHYKKGKVIFEKGETGYYPKYIYAQQRESASIERDFKIMKMQKRFLTDKTLNEIKLEAMLYFEMMGEWELLVLDHQPSGQQQFNDLAQPTIIKYKRETVNSPDIWHKGTVLAPSAELRKYTRK